MKYFQLESFNITFYGIHSQNILILIKIFFFLRVGKNSCWGKLGGLLGCAFSCPVRTAQAGRGAEQVHKFHWNCSLNWYREDFHCQRQRGAAEKGSKAKAAGSRRKLINLVLSPNLILVVSLLKHIYNPYPVYFNGRKLVLPKWHLHADVPFKSTPPATVIYPTVCHCLISSDTPISYTCSHLFWIYPSQCNLLFLSMHKNPNQELLR